MPRSKTPPISLERLKELLRYDPDTGEFTRLVATGRHGCWPAGMVARSYPMRAGHIRISIDYRHYLVHRVAWFYMTGSWPVAEIDHVDRNPANNKWVNLREASKAQNGRNRNPQKTNRSGVRGVYWNPERRKWRVEIRPPGSKGNKYLGDFSCLASAAKSRKEAERHYYGEFAPSFTDAHHR